jgi:hypothetical protein
MSNPHVKRIRGYLRRAILLNYLARLASVLLFLAFLFYLGVYVGGKWAFYDPPYGHAVTLYHAGHLLIALLFLIFGVGRNCDGLKLNPVSLSGWRRRI